MKIHELKKRLKKNRPMIAITVRMPEDVVGDMKKVAPLLGFSGYQPLLRYYIGKCLRDDLEHLEQPEVSVFVENLKKCGVKANAIQKAWKQSIQQQIGC